MGRDQGPVDASASRRRNAAGVARMMRSMGAALVLLSLTGLGLMGGPRGANAAPLVDAYNLKVGVSYSSAFVNVTRNSDGSEASLVADSDYSPYLSLATPPWFAFDGNLALGISASYSQFEASKQDFATEGPASIGSTAKARMLIVTPGLSYYLGKSSESQFLRFSFGLGWAWANVGGNVQFGDKAGAEPPEELASPSGASQAVSFSVEYRIGRISIAAFGGGPKLETEQHTIQLGDNSIVVSYVIPL